MTQVSWVKQFVLALALVVLGTFAFWLEYKHKPAEEALQAANKKVLSKYDFKALNIQSLEIGDGNATFHFDCEDKECKAGNNSKWKMTLPLQTRAEDSNVNGMISAMTQLDSTEIFELKQETPEKRAALIKEYGLAKETLGTAFVRKVGLKTNQGQMVVYFGNPHPISQDIFAAVEETGPNDKPSGKIDENKIYLIPSHYKSYFGHDESYWRDKRIVNFSGSEVESFEINRKKVNSNESPKDLSQEKIFSVSRSGKDWMIKVGKSEYPGDPENIDTFLNTMTYLNAKSFVSNSKTDAQAKAALKGTKPVVTLVVRRKGAPDPIAFEVVEKPSSTPDMKEKGHAKVIEKKLKDEEARIFVTLNNADPVYELVNADQGKLNKSLKDLRLAKLLSTSDRFAVKKILVEGIPVGQPLSIVMKDGKWAFESEKTELNTEAVQKTLDRISGNRIRDYLKGSAIASGENQGIKVTLSDEKGAIKAKIAFWKNKNVLYARDLNSQRTEEAFLVDSTVMDGLPWEHSYFSKK